MFKRIIAIFFCVIFLFSFSLNIFAGSFDVFTYKNVSSVTESFLSAFLSYCGVDVEFFDYDIDYTGTEYTNAAWYNLTARFANYIQQYAPEVITEIEDFATYCGVSSPFNSSSYTWEGRFKYCRSIVSHCISLLYNFLFDYWVKTSSTNQNFYGLVPLSMSLTVDGEQYTGCYTKVRFFETKTLNDWYLDFGTLVQSYCNNDVVGDDFVGANLVYRWNYGSLPIYVKYPGESSITRATYVDYIERYIEYYNNKSSGGSSGDSSDDSSDNTSSDSSGGGSTGDSSEDTSSDSSSEENYSTLDDYYNSFYYHFFYTILSTFDIKIFTTEYSSQYVLDKLVDRLWSYVKGDIPCAYIEKRYPEIYSDYVNIANYEYEKYKELKSDNFYAIDFFATDYHSRFVYGFLELFDSYILRGDTSYGTSSFKHCVLYDFDGLTAIFSFGAFYDIDTLSSTDWNENLYKKYFNFVCNYNGPTAVTCYYDVSNYFFTDSFNSVNYQVFAGYNLPSYHANHPPDSIYYWDYDPNAIYEVIENIIIEEIVIPVPGIDYSLLSPTPYLNQFFLWTSTFFSFLYSCLSFFPSSLFGVISGGFILVVFVKWLLKPR